MLPLTLYDANKIQYLFSPWRRISYIGHMKLQNIIIRENTRVFFAEGIYRNTPKLVLSCWVNHIIKCRSCFCMHVSQYIFKKFAMWIYLPGSLSHWFLIILYLFVENFLLSDSSPRKQLNVHDNFINFFKLDL